MAYRIVEITKPSEVHVTNHQLIVEQEEAKFSIPLEDIEIIICIGAKIRFSTIGLGEITQARIIVVGFGKKHEPQTLIEPYFPNQRHVTLLQNQINMNEDFKNQLWDKIIKRKILNSARNLAILGLEGFEKISEYSSSVKNGDEKNIEAMAAQEYFQFYHKGLNRRTSDPVNSALNYGYAIIRSYIIKALISTGFHCALGLHHHNEYNSFNLADDLIEPCRAMIDQAAFSIIGNDINLSTKQRRELTGVLHKNCKIDEKIIQISNGIETMVDSLKNALLQQNIELLKLPFFLIFIIWSIEFENNCNVKSIKQIRNKNCIKHQNRIKEFLPKTGTVRMLILTENQFSSCVLSQEEVDLQEFHVGAKDLVTL